MRPVNLLPEEYRPRKATGETKGGAYAVLGVLGTLLVMVLGFALVTNQVNSRKTELAQAKTEADQAEAKTQSQGAFADFRQIKQQREQSIKGLAESRFDWERLMRELALVIPEGMWLMDVTASTAGSTAPGGASTGSTPPSGGSTPPAGGSTPPPSGGSGSGASSGTSSSGSGQPAAAPAPPSVKLMGCAKDQDDVATLMVRLRKLYRATDVQLGESAEEENGTSGAATSGGGTAAVAGSENCGPRRYKFDVTVTFSATPPGAARGGKAPAALGGGS